MAVHILDEVPAGFPGRRLWRGVVVLLGVVLVLVAMLAAIYPLLVAELVVFTLVTHGPAPTFQARDVLILALTTVGIALALWAGLRMIRGRRRLGLYLRKFGFADTTRTVSHALSSAVGRSLRLVTLDDSQVAPLGAGRGRRRLGLVVTILAVAAIAWVVYYVFGGALTRYSENLGKGDPPPTTFGEAIGKGLGEGLAVVFLVLLLVLLATIGLVVGMLGGSVYLAARRAERGATQTFTDERTVDASARKLARASRRTLAARLVVVAVPSAFWQRAVHGLAAVSDVVIIDVSRPTENLLWEIRNIKPLFRGRWVLVGARDLVGPLASAPITAGHDPAGLLARMLDGERILVYGPDPADRRRFARSLRRALEQVSRQPAQPAAREAAPA